MSNAQQQNIEAVQLQPAKLFGVMPMPGYTLSRPDSSALVRFNHFLGELAQNRLATDEVLPYKLVRPANDFGTFWVFIDRMAKAPATSDFISGPLWEVLTTFARPLTRKYGIVYRPESLRAG